MARAKEVGWTIEFRSLTKQEEEKPFEVVEAKKLCNFLMALRPDLEFTLSYRSKQGEIISFNTQVRGPVEYIP